MTILREMQGGIGQGISGGQCSLKVTAIMDGRRLMEGIASQGKQGEQLTLALNPVIEGAGVSHDTIHEVLTRSQKPGLSVWEQG